MAIKKHSWVDANGQNKEAWAVDVIVQSKRQRRLFKTRKEAKAYKRTATSTAPRLSADQ